MTAKTEYPAATRPAAAGGAAVRDRLAVILRSPLLVLGGILVVTCIMYAPILNDWFQTDDFTLLRAANLFGFPRYVREAFDFRDFEPLHFYAYRPMYFVTSDVMYIAFGLHPLPYHLVSIGVHLVNATLVWHIARRLTRSEGIALAAAAIFALHPAYTIPVTWIAAGSSLLATTGQLTCVAAFLEYRRTHENRWYAASLAAYAVGLLYHQEMFLVPVVLVALTLVIDQRPLRQLARPSTVLSFVAFGVVLAAFLVIQGWNTHESGFISLFKPNTGNIRNLIAMVGMSVYPHDMATLDVTHRILVVLGIGSIVLAATLRGARWQVTCVAGVWFGVSLLLTLLWATNLKNPVGALPRKLYPAGPALAILLATAGDAYWREAKRRLPELPDWLPAAALAGAMLLAVAQASRYIDGFGREGALSQAYSDELRQAYPTLPEGSTLYVAGTPEYLVRFCPLICWVRDLVETHYGHVQVELIDPKQAADPSFRTSLRPDDHIFCYRC